MFTYLTLLISHVYTVFYTIYCILPMLLGHTLYIYLYVHILIPSHGIVNYLLDITALPELEAQAFRYTRINIC